MITEDQKNTMKTEIDLVDYIELVSGVPAKRNRKGGNFKTCPFCGGDGHFSVAKNDSTGEWYYRTFSGKCTVDRDGDIFEFIQEYEGVGFLEAAQRLANEFGMVEVAATAETYQPQKMKVKKRVQPPQPAASLAPLPDLRNEFIQLHAAASDDNYFSSRGIGKKVQDEYLLCSHSDGLDYFVNRYREFTDEINRYTKTYKHFIPVIDPNGEVHHFLPYLDKASAPDQFQKVRNLTDRSIRLFNDRYVIEPSLVHDRYIFVTEGVFDALSFEEIGRKAIALNSTSNAGRFLDLVEKNKSNLQNKTIVIAMDNDEAGYKAAQGLIEGLSNMNVAYEVFDLSQVAGGQYKDANEFMQADRPDFEDTTISFISKIETPDLVINYMEDYIKEIRKNAATPPIKTGFKKLDRAFGGGIFSGMYTIGAISSLGKTTLTLQIADSIAASGQDVIFFSLEMGKAEVISKSFSRITSELAREKNDVSIAKTTRSMLMNQAKPEIFEQVYERYLPTARHMNIVEGNFRTNVNTIKEYVERHIQIRGTKPVVIVDYLQILQPVDDRLSDKQAIDRNIVTLKQISRDLDIAVILVSSFNRDNYASVVSFSAFKESGAIEYSSDVVIGLQLHAIHRAAAEKQMIEKVAILDAAKAETPRKIELVVLKNRNGATFARVGFDFIPQFNCWNEISLSNEVLPR